MKMHLKELGFCLLLALGAGLGLPDTVIQINSMRWSQVVSERFLSISIDPLAIILAGKLGPAAIHMAKGLSPLFVRIGGPNTENVRFGHGPSSSNNITVSEDEWVSVNRFAQESRLDLVLCLRAMRRTQTVWDSANALEIISASHRHGFTDIWQMGWDMSEMNGIGGAELGRDIVRLKKILDAFPGYENAPILAPGLSCCMNHFQTRFIKDLLHESSTAVSALPVHLNFSSISLDKIAEAIGTTLVQMDEQIWNKDLLLRSTLPRKPIWMSELEPNSGEFMDAMKWIVKLGSGARFGVQVMMRQPHLLSFHSPTHDYWASLLYKNLVGRFVFDTRILSGNRTSSYIYSHCTHPTNDELTILASKWNYEKGALTVFGINPTSETAKIVVRGLSIKEEPVHLYVLTEDNTDIYKDNSKWHPTHTLFNGQKLILSPKGELPLLSPKERRVSRGQGIPVPPHSIFFIVFPDVKVRTCMTNPFAMDEFQELTKKLTSSHSTPEDSIDSWEDNNAERVYVSFSKRVPVPHKPNNPQEDLKSKLLKDWHKVAGKLGIEKDNKDSVKDNTKYSFYNDQSWLSHLADGLKNEPEQILYQRKLESDPELSRLQKYALLTSAIYGKENNGTNLYQISGNLNEAIDPYSHHYRFTRNTDRAQEKEIKENKNQSSVEPVELVNSQPESNTNVDKDHFDKLIITENHKNIHDYVMNYMKKSRHDSEIEKHSSSIDPLQNFMKDLQHINIAVGHSEHQDPTEEVSHSEKFQSNTSDNLNDEKISGETVSKCHEIMKRSPPKIYEQNSNNGNYDYNQETEMLPSVQTGSQNKEKSNYYNEPMENDYDTVSSFINRKDLTNLAMKRNNFRQIIDENLDKGSAFEIAPEPDLDEVTEVDKKGNYGKKLAKKSTDLYTDVNQDDERVADDRNYDSEKASEITTEDLFNGQTITDYVLDDSNVTENPDALSTITSGIYFPDTTQSYDMVKHVESEKLTPTNENNYSQNINYNLKEGPKLKTVSEIIDKLKSKGMKDFVQSGTYRSAKLEERIQKLESIKSRVAEIKDKIKEELSKAREKLTVSVASMKGNTEYDLNNQPTKRNIYEVPDKLAGLLEKLNFNYMNNIKTNSRLKRSPELSDDEIDELLEREIRETVNEFYDEQMSNMEDEDFGNDEDPMHYLVPALPGTHNILFDREVFPAKIYNMVKRNQLNLDDIYDEESMNVNKLKNYWDHNIFDGRQSITKKKFDPNHLQSLLDDDEEFSHPRSEIFDPIHFRRYKSNLMRNKRKYGPSLASRYGHYDLDDDDDDFDPSIFLHPRYSFGGQRYRRSLKKNVINPPVHQSKREKRSVNFDEVNDNMIRKSLPSNNIETDNLKLIVDDLFKNKKASLFQLAEEYTKLADGLNKNIQIPIASADSVVSDINKTNEINKPVFDNINQIITDGEKFLSNGMDAINYNHMNNVLDENYINNVTPLEISKDDESEDYPEDWVSNAERVSPPLEKPKTNKKKSNSNSHHFTSTLGRLIGKIKHIIEMISEFRISDYIKGKRKTSNTDIQ